MTPFFPKSIQHYFKRLKKEKGKTMENSSKDMIVVYGTSWCGDTNRARRFLDQNKISYRWIDIDQDQEGRAFVEKTNRGMRSVPTIVFTDGSILVEPSTFTLANKLGIPM